MENECFEVDISKHPSGIVPTIQKIVSTVDLGCKLNLKDIAMRTRNSEYKPKRFGSITMRIKNPNTTALIFDTGKVVCTGAKNEGDSKLATRKFARIIQKLGTDAKFKDFKIQNIVMSCDVNFPIRLETLTLVPGSTYEPEIFPGLIYRVLRPKMTMLVFTSGKVVLTGAKKREDTYKTFEKVYPLLVQHKKIFPPNSSN